ncbi:hypothetical protein IMZ48_09765 [Candidatus Bathyarchaeota archaeon]|nr:hypothetical protein [Candidatus Bathyarchaeota archaeon]
MALIPRNYLIALSVVSPVSTHSHLNPVSKSHALPPSPSLLLHVTILHLTQPT